MQRLKNKIIMPDRSKVVLRHVLERQAEKQPDKGFALFENGEEWTYKEALQEAYKAANRLYDIGVRRGENILVFMPNSLEWIRAWLGIVTLGAVIVPVNTAYKGEMLRHICQDSQSKYLITTSGLAERLKGLGLKLKVIDPDCLAEGSSDEPKLDAPIEPWDTHAIIYTSGTTGPSKGVITPYLHMHMNGVNVGNLATPDDTFLIDLPLFHLGGIAQAYALWVAGGRIALRSVFSGSRYWETVRNCGATMAFMIGTIPYFLENTKPRSDDADNPLRIALCAPMVSDPSEFKARFGIEVLLASYGMTETQTVFITQCPITDPKSCGQPRPGVEVRLVDDYDIPVPPGDVGELIVRTDRPWEMNAGYWRQSEETARAWRNGWFHTGDMFRCDNENNYYFVDRKKDAIRRRGENISSFEVEREVTAHPDVMDAACIGMPGQYGEEEVKVFVVPRKGSTIDPAELTKFLIPRLPYFMVPRFVEMTSELPKTQSNRVKKYELRKQGNRPDTWDREAAGIIVKRDSFL